MSRCMLGLLTRDGGETVPGACTTRNFTYLARGPWIPKISLKMINLKFHSILPGANELMPCLFSFQDINLDEDFLDLWWHITTRKSLLAFHAAFLSWIEIYYLHKIRKNWQFLFGASLGLYYRGSWRNMHFLLACVTASLGLYYTGSQKEHALPVSMRYHFTGTVLHRKSEGTCNDCLALNYQYTTQEVDKDNDLDTAQ